MIVVISTYPPLQDGVARYALQQVQSLFRTGEKVLTVGVPGGNADVVVNFKGGFRAWRLARHIKVADRAIIHWHDNLFYVGGASGNIPTSLALILLFWSFPQIEIICHEAYGIDVSSFVGVRKSIRVLARKLRQKTWKLAPRVNFHSDSERRRMEADVGVTLDDSRVRLV